MDSWSSTQSLVVFLRSLHERYCFRSGQYVCSLIRPHYSPLFLPTLRRWDRHLTDFPEKKIRGLRWATLGTILLLRSSAGEGAGWCVCVCGGGGGGADQIQVPIVHRFQKRFGTRPSPDPPRFELKTSEMY